MTLGLTAIYFRAYGSSCSMSTFKMTVEFFGTNDRSPDVISLLRVSKVNAVN